MDETSAEVVGLSQSSARPSYTLSIPQQRQQLPIYQHQLPQYLVESNWADHGLKIACVQPRRLAATALAERVACEMNTVLGEKVGYSVRFKSCCQSDHLQIKYITDGMLFREIMSDPLLTDYSVVMVDEAHERTVHMDLLLGLLKKEIEDVLDMIAEQSSSRMELWPMALYAGLPAEQLQGIFDPPPRATRKVIVATNLAETSVTIEGIKYVIDCGYTKLRYFNPDTQAEILRVVPLSQASAIQRSGRAGRTGPGKAYRLYTNATFNQFTPGFTTPEIQRCNLASALLQLKGLGIDQLGAFPFPSRPPIAHVTAALALLYALGAIDDNAWLTPTLGQPMAQLPLNPMLSRAVWSGFDLGCTTEIIIIAAMLQLSESSPDANSDGGSSLWQFPTGHHDEARQAHRRFAVKEGDPITLLNVYRAYVAHQRSPLWCRRHYISYQALTQADAIIKQLQALVKHYQGAYLESRSTSTATAIATPAPAAMGTPSSDTIARPVPDSLPSSNDPQIIRKCLTAGYFAHSARMLPDGSFEPVATLSQATTLPRTAPIPSLFIHPSSVLFKSLTLYVIYESTIETTKTFMKNVTVIDPAWLYELAPKYFG
ncbi:ATPdependent RNA helicase [Dimargaris cristalligena]|nr:ATPdependent RNA helicase [Dimargaris cristalligena]